MRDQVALVEIFDGESNLLFRAFKMNAMDLLSDIQKGAVFIIKTITNAVSWQHFLLFNFFFFFVKKSLKEIDLI